MLRLKGCPRCHGDLREGKDRYGEYLTCLQCGYHQSDGRDAKPSDLPLVTRRGRPRKPAAGPS